MLATMATTATQMSSAERLATEAYARDLKSEFRANQVELWKAREGGDTVRYLACGDKSDSLFAELLGVGRALRTGVLPPVSCLQEL